MGSEQDAEYQAALDALSTLISGRQRADGRSWSHAFEMMRVYLERLGLQEELPKLSVIHVAGTKGKGSTCAVVERVLREAGYRTGLYTSPHLIDVRERIRINGAPVERDAFLRNLWWCFNRLKEQCDEEAGMPAYFRFLTLLGFKIFLEAGVDVVVLEVGIGGRLDATNCVPAPVVCGVTPLGFDHMELLGNTLPEIAREKAGIFKPGVPAFTVPQPDDALAALRERAAAVGAPLEVVPGWESFRPADPAQPLRLGLAGEHQKMNASIALTLAATWEARSAEATAKQGQRAAQRAERLLREGVVAPEYAAGLAAARWPGRAQIVHDAAVEDGALFDVAAGTWGSSDSAPTAGAATAAANSVDSPSSASGATANGHAAPAPSARLPRLSFFLDGAHTAESMATCAHWFADATAAEEEATAAGAGATSAAGDGAAAAAAAGADRPAVQRVLLFNCMQERDPQALLQPLAQSLAERQVGVQHALFVPASSTYLKLGQAEPAVPDLSWQQAQRMVWEAQAAAAVRKQGARTLPAAPAAPALALPPLPALPSLPLQDTVRGAVLPNLQVTLDWLRRCVRETPSLRMQVLVTGSLYLVGDMLKLLGKHV